MLLHSSLQMPNAAAVSNPQLGCRLRAKAMPGGESVPSRYGSALGG
jgi:hypothetical protein